MLSRGFEKTVKSYAAQHTKRLHAWFVLPTGPMQATYIYVKTAWLVWRWEAYTIRGYAATWSRPAGGFPVNNMRMQVQTARAQMAQTNQRVDALVQALKAGGAVVSQLT